VSSLECAKFTIYALILERPFYIRGCAIGCGFTGLISILALGLHFKLEHENKKRDREYGTVEDNTQVDVTVSGDKNVNFRYLT
jgi:hypothetical protein